MFSYEIYPTTNVSKLKPRTTAELFFRKYQLLDLNKAIGHKQFVSGLEITLLFLYFCALKCNRRKPADMKFVQVIGSWLKNNAHLTIFGGNQN